MRIFRKPKSGCFVIKTPTGYVGRYSMDHPYTARMPSQKAAAFLTIGEAQNFLDWVARGKVKWNGGVSDIAKAEIVWEEDA